VQPLATVSGEAIGAYSRIVWRLTLLGWYVNEGALASAAHVGSSAVQLLVVLPAALPQMAPGAQLFVWMLHVCPITMGAAQTQEMHDEARHWLSTPPSFAAEPHAAGGAPKLMGWQVPAAEQ